ncbi:MAG: serine/threonine protein kinase, partial [Deltaproteobacteria bacterium]|nr:serine/threonine protein kinase [Deltaproteobacteria bacterium]
MTPNLNKKIQTRLRAVALGVAGVHLLSLALDPVNLLLGFSPPSHLLEKNIISGSLIVISLLVYIVNRHGSAESRFAKHASTFASAYHIIVAAGIELSAQLTPWPAPEAFPYPAMRLVSWVALWIVIYPLFVPLRPRRAALTALAAATMGPLTLALTLLVGNTWPGVGVAVFVHMPSLVAASLAAISARIVYGLETRASSTRLLGNYVLKERIAQGGMGDIWEASHRLLARPAAVKLIRTHPDDDPALQARRFEREARATATLESPHTVELYDFGRDDDGTFYYVMELLEGLDLEDLVEHHGPQPSSRTIHVLRQVCDSLAEAHDKGLLHRDIKPSNIFIEPRGLSQDTVKVLDFGL